jgi:N-sulfoglucosamine sulfohydrolase
MLMSPGITGCWSFVHANNQTADLCCAVPVCAHGGRTNSNPSPNILLLMAEDMSPRVGAFGDAVAVTPNLDALAAEGVRYTNTFTTAGVCAPSRAAHILGMHQIATGTQHMRSSTRPEGGYYSVPPQNAKAYPELLRAAGYYTYTDDKLDYQFSSPFAHSGPGTIWNRLRALQPPTGTSGRPGNRSLALSVFS